MFVAMSTREATPLVSVCIPVFNGAEFVEETLAAAYAQTHPAVEVLISVDLSDDDSAQLCQAYEGHPHTRVHCQSEHLGWVRNCNVLLREARGDYFCILPHDDLIPSDYISELLREFERHPRAVNCYPRIHNFGLGETIMAPSSIEGASSAERVKCFFSSRQRYGAPLRGLVRRSMIDDDRLFFLSENAYQGIGAEILLEMQHCIAGEVRLVGRVTYYKRRHGNGTSHKWTNMALVVRAHAYVRFSELLARLVGDLVLFGSQREREEMLCACRDFCPYWINTQQLSDPRVRQLAATIGRVPRPFLAATSHEARTALVLGGGVQGCCVALMLAKNGYDVTLIDKDRELMAHTSVGQEGKVHLGFVYGLDASGATGRKLMLDALTFSSYLEYLLDCKVNWARIRSIPFNYFVASDSAMSASDVQTHFSQLQSHYEGLLNQDSRLSYCGVRPPQLFRRTTLPERVSSDLVQACFATEEVALHPESCAELIVRVITSRPSIALRLGENVEAVRRMPDGQRFVVTTTDAEGAEQNVRSDLVFNCTWHGRTAVDKTLQIDIGRYNNYRYKFGIVSRQEGSMANVAAATMLQGPYGDFVQYPEQSELYYCWYPYNMIGMYVDTEIPVDWQRRSGDCLLEKAGIRP